MIIKHRIEHVNGDIDTDTAQLTCVLNRNHANVYLCIDANMSIPFAKIKLHSKDMFSEARAIENEAYKFGEEIAKRWNKYNDMKDLLSKAGSLIEDLHERDEFKYSDWDMNFTMNILDEICDLTGKERKSNSDLPF